MQGTAQQLPLFESDTVRPGSAPGFSVRQSNRAKRLSIKVFPGGKVEVVVPKRTSARSVQEFVEENRDWIDRARESLACKVPPEDSTQIPDIIALPAIERKFIVRYRPVADTTTVRYREANGIVTLSGATGDKEQCGLALKRWLAKVAKQAFAPRLEALAKLTGTPYRQMHVRMQRTCWGSRSSSGTISLNLCLLFVRPELLRYLLVHELCHGRHMNHSRRFWQLVGRFEPSYRKLDKQLGESWRVVPAWLDTYY